MIILLICSILIVAQVEGNSPRKYLNPGLANPSLRDNPPPGCHPPSSQNKTREQANEYSGGCSRTHRCRRD